MARADASATPPSIPPGLRVYAIGDIHGRLDLLDALLGMIEAREAAWPAEKAMLIFLGDYVDRGPDSRGVVERLLTGLPERFDAAFLRGNHEDILLHCLRGPGWFDNWAMNGGLATIKSYGVEIDAETELRRLDAKRILAAFRRAMPEAHRAFYRGLPVSREIGDYFFVHAGVRPGVPLGAQRAADLTFIRDPFLSHQGDFGKIIVHGHTPVAAPEFHPNRIAIDTGAVFTGRLTALCLEGAARSFLTTEGRGRV
ncbi:MULTISPECIES: metallophosphoesterase family protein [Rhodomicrobium]|uniref:metallophosphoesterase family protein n=1 Tax=Rhodomicrobium TaxID=1068 RepID=UPI000B4B0447|nr:MULTISPECIES: metallophosphoesterase family protein [Rhodomicrobium]